MKFKICDLMDVNRGASPRPIVDYLADKGYKWLKISDFSFGDRYVYKTKEYIKEEGITKTRFLKKGTLILTNSATPGIPIFLGEDMCLHDGFLYFQNIKKKIISEEYLYYWFLLKRNDIVNQANGSVFKNLKKEIIMNLSISLPCLNMQKKVVKVLDTIIKKIELNNHTNDNLFNMCNAIFHNYIDKYSELIKYTKIIDIVDRVVTGKTPLTKNKKFWNGDIPFITIPDMHNQVFTIDTERTISEMGAKSIIPENSISVSCIATVGLVSISTKKSQTNQQINSIVLKNDYDLYYLFEFLSEQESFMKNIAGGSTTYNINKTTFENIEIPYLPQNIIQEFHNTVCKLFDKIKLNQLENKNLEQLRDTLLPKLMNGEIDLDKIEI